MRVRTTDRIPLSCTLIDTKGMFSFPGGAGDGPWWNKALDFRLLFSCHPRRRGRGWHGEVGGAGTGGPRPGPKDRALVLTGCILDASMRMIVQVCVGKVKCSPFGVPLYMRDF